MRAQLVRVAAPPLLVLSTVAVLLGLSQALSLSARWPATMVGPLLQGWGAALVWCASALLGGAALVRRLSPLGRDGFWPLSFCAGAVLFAVAMGALGWAQALGPVTFYGLPLVFLAAGWPTVCGQLVARMGAPPRTQVWTAAQLVALCFGSICLLLVALQTLSPDNINYDAGWYHLRAAERYALAGGLVRTPEGDMLLSLPHLTSWLYTWAFLLPGATVDARVRLALLLELCCVLGTLTLLPALARALLPSLARGASRLAWVAFFFWPSIFIYDTGIMGGADHVVAWFSTATLVAWFQARQGSWRDWLLLGVVGVGLLAKYTSLYLLVPLTAAVLVDLAVRWRAQRAPRPSLQAWLRGPALAVALALALSTPYWLRNWAWYHNPVYPLASGVFPSQPWDDDAAVWSEGYATGSVFSEHGSASHRLKHTLAALFDYQTHNYGWDDMTGGQAIFGSAYFLSLLGMLFLAQRGRLLALALILHAGIAIWFNTHQHHMRYLTVLAAPMAGAAAAVAGALWARRSGQLAVLAAVGYHLVSFGDMPLRKTHRMAGKDSTLGIAARWLAAKGERSGALVSWEKVGASLPPRAKVLLHGVVPALGLGRQSVTDVIGLTFGINYGRWGSLREVHARLRKMGVTHLLWDGRVEQYDSIAGEALFAALAFKSQALPSVSGHYLAELADPPPLELSDRVLYLGCAKQVPTGLYRLPQLAFPLPPSETAFPKLEPIASADASSWQALQARASYLVKEEGCTFEAPSSEFTQRSQAANFGRERVYFVRASGVAAP